MLQLKAFFQEFTSQVEKVQYHSALLDDPDEAAANDATAGCVTA